MARILVVEDSPTQALPIRFVLQKAGFQVELALNGIAALTAIERAIPDAVLTDLQMPEMDGLRLVEAIRHRYPALPVVLMTAGGSDQIFLQALRAGAAHYASKQGLDFEIVDTLEKILRVARAELAAEQLTPCLALAQWQWSIENDLSVTPAIVAHVTKELTSWQLFDQTALLQVGVACTEAISNAIVRGNLAISARPQENPAAFDQLVIERRQQSPYRERRVHVGITINPLQVAFVIRDEGAGFDLSGTPDPADAGCLIREDRRGVFLMRTFMDGVMYNDSGTEVTMFKRRTIGPPLG